MSTRTAAQQREQARLEYDAFLAACPTRQVLDVIGGRWAGLLLSALMGGPQRYAGLARTVAGVSPKMLTQTLRQLEREGLVRRTVTAEVPVRVDYALTPLGEDLAPLLRALKTWSETHIDQVHEARAVYDGRGPGT